MPISKDDAREIAQAIGSSMAGEVGPETRMPLGWILSGIGILLTLTITGMGFWHDVNTKVEERASIWQVHQWIKATAERNPEWRPADIYDYRDRNGN